MYYRIKVFSTNALAEYAGERLTNQYEEWVEELTKTKAIDVKQIHTNSNKYGWSLTVLYKFL